MEIIPEGIQVETRSIAIVGWDEGGAGQVHSWIEKSGEYRVSCFVNASGIPIDIDIETERRKREAKLFDFPTKDSFKGRPLVTSSNWIDVILGLGIKKALIMTQDKRERLKHIREATAKGIELIKAVHPTALILEDARLGDNIVILARAIVGYRSEIFPGVFINTNSQIDHHNVIKDCVSIDPGVITAGNVVIEECAHVHTGAVIINKIRIGSDSVVGAGSVVIHDVPSDVMVAGVPEKIIKNNKR